MKRARTLVSATMLMAFGPVVPARAESVAVCSFNFDNGTIGSPGVVSGETRAAEWKAGPSPFICVGSVGGHQITGPGVIFEYGTLEGSCEEGKGMGWQIGTLPTTGGTIRVDNAAPFWWRFGAGTLEGQRMRGTFVFWPTAGNCFTEPVTRYGQVTQTILTG
ncbi:MAG: hypothetical protein AB1679_10030 [Actinomycetota bacterium]